MGCNGVGVFMGYLWDVGNLGYRLVIYIELVCLKKY